MSATQDPNRKSGSPLSPPPPDFSVLSRRSTDSSLPTLSSHSSPEAPVKPPAKRSKSAESIEHLLDPALLGEGEGGHADLPTAKPPAGHAHAQGQGGATDSEPQQQPHPTPYASTQAQGHARRSPMPYGAWPLQTDFSARATGSAPDSLITDDSAMDSSSVLTDDSFVYSVFNSRQSSVADLQGLRDGDSEAETPARRGGEDEGVPAPKPKKSHAKKMPPGHIKRARNAFILYRKHITDQGLIPASVEVKHQNISVIAAKMWREAPQAVRARFQEEARIEKEEHQRLYPNYRYQPVFRRTDIVRRRVRKDLAEDDKVEAVAEALINGKTGDKLEREIREQMAARSEDSGSESDASSYMSRRRRESGQLSKGALRAQRAANRAKQLRHDVLGANLLQMSMLNAQQQQAYDAASAAAAASFHAQGRMGAYGMPAYTEYAPVGYDYDGRPVYSGIGGGAGSGTDSLGLGMGVGLGGAGLRLGMGAAQERDGSPMLLSRGLNLGAPPNGGGMSVDYSLPPPGSLMGPAEAGGAGGQDLMGGQSMYRLPPIDAVMPYGQDSTYESVGNAYESEYVADMPYGATHGDDLGAAADAGGSSGAYDLPYQAADAQQSGPYRSSAGAVRAAGLQPLQLGKSIDPRLKEWSALAEQKTPSRDVPFNHRLFGGALGSADMDDGLERVPAFDEALEQANEAY